MKHHKVTATGHRAPALLPALLCLGAITVATSAAAEPPRLPDSFPVAMTFGAAGGLAGDELKKRMEEQAPYPIIHAPGLDSKSRMMRKRYPDKIITLQDAYGGIGRELQNEVWPGHCLYKAGTLLTADCSAEQTVLTVAEPARIIESQKALDQVSAKFPYALIVYALDEAGNPDWSRAEHVVLTGIQGDHLTVKRKQYGSKPLSFQAGQAAVAAHMMFWTRQWQLNLSLACPRGGPDNLTAGEWFAGQMAKRVKDAEADGIEFDVGRWTWGLPEKAAMDCDNDRVADYGYLDGINSFGLGGQVFFRELRKRLGPDKFIQTDSNDAIFGVRGWNYLNGVQLESFPNANHFDRFSEAFHHLRLWVENVSAKPAFSYAFTKTPTTVFANARLEDGSKTDFRFRVGLAADCLVGMPHPFASIGRSDFDPANDVNAPNTGEWKGVFVWDEYHGGDRNDWQWLGRPTGPARQDDSAMKPDDLLASAKWHWAVDPGFEANGSEENGTFSATVSRIPENVVPATLWFGARLEPQGGPLPTLASGKEYTLAFDAQGDDAWEVAGQTFERVPRSVMVGGIYSSDERKPLSTLADSQWRTCRVNFIAPASAPAMPVFGVSEQVGKTSLRNIRLYASGCERWSREFEHGLVLLNMTREPWKAPIADGKYQRLKGSQCPEVNTGEPVGSEVVVPPWDALFLITR